MEIIVKFNKDEKKIIKRIAKLFHDYDEEKISGIELNEKAIDLTWEAQGLNSEGGEYLYRLAMILENAEMVYGENSNTLVDWLYEYEDYNNSNVIEGIKKELNKTIEKLGE